MRSTDRQAPLFELEIDERDDSVRVVRSTDRDPFATTVSTNDPLAFYARVVMAHLEGLPRGIDIDDEDVIETVSPVIGFDWARRAIYYLKALGYLVEVSA